MGGEMRCGCFLLPESPARFVIEFGYFPLNAIQSPEEHEGFAGDLALLFSMQFE